MRIVIATPLYPPEIAEPAPYVKELTKRLQDRYKLSILTYGRLPEVVPGVEIIAIDKRRALPLRLISFTRALYRAAKDADIIYAMNGPSVELPVSIVMLLTRVPLIMSLDDLAAHEYAGRHLARHILERIALAHARSVVRDFPPMRPEILPLEPRPVDALAAYESGWESHTAYLTGLFDHA